MIVTTHTPRHLRRTLLGVARQSRRADSVTVTVDGDCTAPGAGGGGSAGVREVVAAAAADFGLRVRLVTRAHQDVCRSAQVRNNGARAVIGDDTDLLVFYDGDCMPERSALAAFEELDARGKHVCIGHWVPLTQQETDALDEAAIAAGTFEPMTPERWARLSQRVARYRRHLLLRRTGLLGLLGQGHKPKLASGNFAVRLGLFRAVNGFDEQYEGYGQEDDDLGRRLYRAAGSASRIGIAVDRALVFHQWHPTRAPVDWHAQPGVARFGRPYTVRCERGLERPVDQPLAVVEEIGRGAGR